MRIVVQRCSRAEVRIDGRIAGQINRGFLLLVGITDSDTQSTADLLAKKIAQLRVFEDEQGKMNLSLNDVGGSVLSISQFTLYADCKHGNRPSFTDSMGPQRAEELYNYIADSIRPHVKSLGTGVFGADMQVSLVNDGPFTVILDSAAI